jgi:hypothetical protein
MGEKVNSRIYLINVHTIDTLLKVVGNLKAYGAKGEWRT